MDGPRKPLALNPALRQYSLRGCSQMSPGTAARQQFMDLREVIEKYKSLAGDFGQLVELARFGFSREEAEKLFGVFDEDYHISRFFHFTNISGAASYSINGFPQSHVSVDAAISEIL
jgi:hypothetical protein